MANKCFETVPGILGKLGKVKNPYPNVDAFSGCLLQHYGNEYFYIRHVRIRFFHYSFRSIKSFGMFDKRHMVKSIWTSNLKTKQHKHRFHQQAWIKEMISQYFIKQKIRKLVFNKKDKETRGVYT
jgi:hypothetical protein